jgi:hypothetical protein
MKFFIGSNGICQVETLPVPVRNEDFAGRFLGAEPPRPFCSWRRQLDLPQVLEWQRLGSSPTAWDALGGVFNSRLAANSWGANRLDLFALGTDNLIYHKYRDGSGWGPSQIAWNALDGV